MRTNFVMVVLLFIVVCSFSLTIASVPDMKEFLEEFYGQLKHGKEPEDGIAAFQNRFFDAMDKQNKGYLLVEDVKDFSQNDLLPFLMEKTKQELQGCDTLKQALELERLEKVKQASEQQLPYMFNINSKYDANKDGKVDRAEFMKASMELMMIDDEEVE